MLWFVYLDGHYVGTVVAVDDAQARVRAEEKFGPWWGVVNVQAQLPKRSTCTRSKVRLTAPAS